MEKGKSVVKKVAGSHRWWMLALGVALIIVGFWVVILWSGHRENMFYAFVAVFALPGGALLAYYGIKKRDEAIMVTTGSAQPDKAQATLLPNSLNIYATKGEDDKIEPQKIAFEYVEKPLGVPQQCTNNNKWYHVHLHDIAKGKLRPFMLPDNQYFDPREFANVLKMPAHRKLYERQASLLQKIAPAVLLLAIVVVGIIFIAATPGG